MNVGANIVTAIESKWRGANGEVGGEAGDEYALRCSFPRLRRHRIGAILETCAVALLNLMADIAWQNEADKLQALHNYNGNKLGATNGDQLGAKIEDIEQYKIWRVERSNFDTKNTIIWSLG